MLTATDLRARGVQLTARVHRRNLALYLYSVLNIVTGLWLVANDRLPTMQLPMLLMIGAHLFVLWQVWHRVRLREAPADTAGQRVLDFHRQELKRQHGAVANAWLWYIAPFMPAFVWELTIWYSGIDTATTTGTASLRLWAMVVLAGVLFWGCVWLWFSRQAARLQLELQQLHGLQAE